MISASFGEWLATGEDNITHGHSQMLANNVNDYKRHSAACSFSDRKSDTTKVQCIFPRFSMDSRVFNVDLRLYLLTSGECWTGCYHFLVAIIS